MLTPKPLNNMPLQGCGCICATYAHRDSMSLLGFGDIDVTKTYKFIYCGGVDGPKPYRFIEPRWVCLLDTLRSRFGSSYFGSSLAQDASATRAHHLRPVSPVMPSAGWTASSSWQCWQCGVSCPGHWSWCGACWRHRPQAMARAAEAVEVAAGNGVTRNLARSCSSVRARRRRNHQQPSRPHEWSLHW